MKKEERRRRLALTVLVSLFVFIIIAVAGFLAGLLIYVMIRLGIIKTVGGRPEAGTMFLLLPIASTIIGVLFTLLTGRISLRPFYLLTNQLNRLASGDFHTRIHFPKSISRHFVFREIEKSFNSAAEELEHTEMLRGDFINNFSHEFKTPHRSSPSPVLQSFCGAEIFRRLKKRSISPSSRRRRCAFPKWRPIC